MNQSLNTWNFQLQDSPVLFKQVQHWENRWISGSYLSATLVAKNDGHWKLFMVWSVWMVSFHFILLQITRYYFGTFSQLETKLGGPNFGLILTESPWHIMETMGHSGPGTLENPGTGGLPFAWILVFNTTSKCTWHSPKKSEDQNIDYRWHKSWL